MPAIDLQWIRGNAEQRRGHRRTAAEGRRVQRGRAFRVRLRHVRPPRYERVHDLGVSAGLQPVLRAVVSAENSAVV